MDIRGARVLVVGATGELGGRLAVLAADGGARVVPAGRDTGRLDAVARRIGAPDTLAFDAYDLDLCSALAERAARHLGGLDAVAVSIGAVAFGRCEELPAGIEEHLMTVNALAPLAVLRGAIRAIRPGGAVGGVTGIVVERPIATAGAYRASKTALTGWLETARLEQRRHHLTVLEARPPHLATGFAERAVAGTPPRLPAGADPQPWAAAILEALFSGAELLRPGPDGSPLPSALARAATPS
ncbi:SDR family oxidoreductase [Kitasatospora sp. A2-31]|uniref:SDR family NAD(P)-dependent oxidoreductase n=1 Tax=Kitasatospora sp. A2-31 TaxID=2916414 RepID=UPI001EEAC06A|nr:SDR family NAD(P)-dependent oxidoreductase [Kitasatospora sp. A2-31]MCG6498406.1 SDR family NAD(P)-dependent oxidoreductase [Kitasatospora sp. A2-31]